MIATQPAQSERRVIPAGFIEALRERFQDRVSTAAAVCEHHGSDESPYPAMPPDVVVYALDTEEVAFVAAHCHAHRVPLIPYGAGSSLEGHLLAVQGGVSVDLSRMDKIVAVHPEDFTVTVQAGVTRKQLNEQIRDTGLFFPHRSGR